MPDEEPTIDATDDDASVVVGDVIEAPEEIIEEGDTTVVVEAPDSDASAGDAVDAVVISETIAQAERIAALEAEIAALREEVADASISADVALSATEALAEQDEAIVEATDEAIVETVEGATVEENILGDDEIETDEIAPVSSRVHPWFRSLAEWRAGSK